MTIQYFGHSFLKLETKNGIIAINPYSEINGLKPPRFKADLLLISENSDFFNNKKTILNNPFILEEPGEIEINHIFVKGIFNFNKEINNKTIPNIAFRIDAEEISLGIITDWQKKVMEDLFFEEFSSIDILFMPVLKGSNLVSESVSGIINQLEPKIFIPLFFYPLGFQKDLSTFYEKFLKEMKKKGEILDKLSIKKNQIPETKESETKIIILKNQI